MGKANKKPRVAAVKDGMDKHNTYQILNERKKDALKKKNYLEVISYSYAMIEDRLLSFLHYLYIINRNNYPFKLESDVKKSITKLLYPKEEKDESNPHFNNLNTKINLIKKIYNYDGDDVVIKNIKEHMEKVLEMNNLKSDIKKLDDWKGYRNEFIHSLYNKNIEALDEIIKDKAEVGMQLADAFDKHSDLLKGKINNIESLRSQIENKKIKISSK